MPTETVYGVDGEIIGRILGYDGDGFPVLDSPDRDEADPFPADPGDYTTSRTAGRHQTLARARRTAPEPLGVEWMDDEAAYPF